MELPPPCSVDQMYFKAILDKQTEILDELRAQREERGPSRVIDGVPSAHDVPNAVRELREPAVQVCTRDAGHDGPCNGLPCPGVAAKLTERKRRSKQ